MFLSQQPVSVLGGFKRRLKSKSGSDANEIGGGSLPAFGTFSDGDASLAHSAGKKKAQVPGSADKKRKLGVSAALANLFKGKSRNTAQLPTAVVAPPPPPSSPWVLSFPFHVE
jgi:hypothetical protein